MSGALKIALIFLLISLLWITLSDGIVFSIGLGKQTLFFINTLKGYFFICFSSCILYLLVKKNDRNLLNKQKLLADTQELAKTGTWEYLVDKQIFRLSKELLCIFQINASESFSSELSLFSYIHPDDIEMVQTKLNWAIKTGKDINLVNRIISTEGEIRFIETITRTEKTNNIVQLIRGTVQDITETIQLRDMLKETSQENKRLGEIMSKVENLIMITDEKGLINWVNPSFEKHTGYLLDEVKEMTPGAVLHGPDTSHGTILYLKQNIARGTSCSVDILNYKKSGEKYWISVTLTPIFDNGKKLTGFIAIQSDITARKEAEARLQQHNKLLKEIAWMASHEIRRPVSSILALNNLISKAETLNEKEEYITMMDTCAKDLDGIVRVMNNKIFNLGTE